ncbi:fasciclin domain-containing protein [Synechococcus sp. R5-13]
MRQLFLRQGALCSTLGPPVRERLLTADIRAANGIIHVIDAVLIPPR